MQYFYEKEAISHDMTSFKFLNKIRYEKHFRDVTKMVPNVIISR